MSKFKASQCILSKTHQRTQLFPENIIYKAMYTLQREETINMH